MVTSNCRVWAGQKLRFIKGHEARGFLSNLGLNFPVLSKLPILGDTLF